MGLARKSQTPWQCPQPAGVLLLTREPGPPGPDALRRGATRVWRVRRRLGALAR